MNPPKANISTDEKVYSDVLSQLNTRQLTAGEMLPSLRVLAAEYQTTVTSIRKAVDRAVAEGLLEKRHGKGIFVADTSTRSRSIMLICQLSGDLFSDFTSAFMQRFKTEASCSLLMEPSPETPQEAERLEAKINDSLADRGLDAIFYMANSGSQVSFLGKYREKLRLYKFFMDEKKEAAAGDKVLSDWYAGGRNGMLHLHENGCDDVLLITHTLNTFNKQNVNGDFLRGCHKAAKETGMRLTEVHAHVDSIEFAQGIQSALQERPAINGVFAFGDYYASRAYPVIQQCGRVIGEDIAVLGYYNTPWSQVLEPTLSSMEIYPDQIVNKLVDAYLGQAVNGAKLIAPGVVNRNSTVLTKNHCSV